VRRKFPKPYRLRLSARRVPIILLGILALLFTGQRIAIAQANAGITGTVTDASGGAVQGVKITITNQETAAVTHLETGTAGTYVINGLNPGKYTITAEGSGFKKAVQKDVNVEVSVTSTIDIALTTGAATDTVEVTSDAIALNTTQPQLGSTIEPEVVAALPVEVSGRGRQIDSLQFLAPGTTGSTFSHRIGGGVDFEQEIVYNGIPVAQPETEGYTTNFNPPFEMVQEFRVERSTFAAQFGLGMGALTYQMASGTNRYHGDLFEINRNDLFDSVGFFNGPPWNSNNVKKRAPRDHENNYGFTVGGPLTIPHLYNGHDRTFGHYSQEWFKLNADDTRASTVPTAAMKAGDFSSYVDSNGNVIPIFDPLTGQQFVCNSQLNVICQDRFSTNSKLLLPYLPDPDTTGTGGGGLENNKNFVPYPNPQTNQLWGFTIDQAINTSQGVHFSVWHNHFHNLGFDNPPFVTPPNPLNSIRDFPAQGSGYLLTYNYTLTPHLVMTAGAGWIGEINNQFNHSKYSFPAVVDGVVPPSVTFDGPHAPTSWGTGGANTGSVNRKLGIAIVNNWLWTKGRQTFNIGFDFRRSYQDDNEEQTAGGHFSFSAHTTSVPNSKDPNFGSYGSSFASFLLGEVDEANRSNSQELKLRNYAMSPYIQDDIALTPKLKINLGVRWDIMAPFTENNNNVVFFNPVGKDPHYGGLAGDATKFGSCTGCAGYSQADFHFGHIGPRIGFAYKISDKSVVQGGFAIAFLNGGAYEYGTNKVAVNYGNLLVGSYSANSRGGNQPAFGSWDVNSIPNPQAKPFNTTLGAGTQINAFSRNDNYAPYAEQWNLNYQRELPYNMFLTAAWIGNRVIHLPSGLNPINQLDPKYVADGSQISPCQALLPGNPQNSVLTDTFAPGGCAQQDGFTQPYANYEADFGGSSSVQQSFTPYPQFSNIFNNFEGSGTTYYQSGQLEVEKRFSNGLSFLVGYTLSHQMDNTGSGFSSFQNGVQNKYNQKPEWAISGNNPLQTLKISGTYELPIGPHKQHFNNHGVTGQVLGGWQVGWILDYEAGTPFGPSSNTIGIPGNTNRPDRVNSVGLGTASYTKERDYFLGKGNGQIFNPAAFSKVSSYTLGNAIRNYADLKNPAFYNESLNARKKFFFGERFTGILQIDYFNALNRTIFNGPDNQVNDSNFGLATNKGSNISNRQGQAQFRLEF